MMFHPRHLHRAASGKLLRFVVALVAALTLAPAIYADSTPKNASQGGIQIQASYDGGPATTYTLGSFNVSLSNFPYQGYNYGHMLSTFTVNTGANAPPATLFSGMKLHWYQQVQSLPNYDSTTYLGNYVVPWPGTGYTSAMPITDPPSGGWDYMYNGARVPANIVPGYAIFVDTDPFYYTRAAELSWVPSSTGQVVSQPGVKYTIEDYPGYRMNPGVSFTDYLVAEATTPNPLDPMGLRPGQLTILGGFTWTIALTAGTYQPDLKINSTFAGTPNGAVDNMNLGMLNGNFPTWNPQTHAGWAGAGATSTVVDFVPLPPAVWTGLGGLAVVIAGTWLQRHQQAA